MTAIPPFSGFGLGLRKPHMREFLETSVPVDFVEVISENYMMDGGKQLRLLEDIRARYPLILHGVSLSIGGAGGLDGDHLARLVRLAVEKGLDLFALCRIGHAAMSGHDIVIDVMRLGHARDGDRCGRVRQRVFQQQLGPARAVEVCRPIRQ